MAHNRSTAPNTTHPEKDRLGPRHHATQNRHNPAKHKQIMLRHLCATDAGIDPYTRAVSDVYEDLFRQGSFIGKGIYSVDAFEQALADRFPDNRILSHDLIEVHIRPLRLVSDAMLYEDYPARYSADVSRRHRWIRGDWPLLPGFCPASRLRASANAIH